MLRAPCSELLAGSELAARSKPSEVTVKIKLLTPHANYKAGHEWNCPWATVAVKLIEEGKALALEAADLHLNPAGAGDQGEAEQPAGPTEPKKRAKQKKTKKPATTE